MKKLLSLLLILSIIGILWLSSKFWDFSREDYVNTHIEEKAQGVQKNLDLSYLEIEFGPAFTFFE